jgi:hypothetical protein
MDEMRGPVAEVQSRGPRKEKKETTISNPSPRADSSASEIGRGRLLGGGVGSKAAGTTSQQIDNPSHRAVASASKYGAGARLAEGRMWRQIYPVLKRLEVALLMRPWEHQRVLGRGPAAAQTGNGKDIWRRGMGVSGAGVNVGGA